MKDLQLRAQQSACCFQNLVTSIVLQRYILKCLPHVQLDFDVA